jgi:hypothetical protein
MSGTSAAAPQVAGMVALLMQVVIDKNLAPLSAATIRDYVLSGAIKSPKLRANSYIDVDVRRRPGVKQSNPSVKPHLIGKGKINWPKTRALLPP